MNTPISFLLRLCHAPLLTTLSALLLWYTLPANAAAPITLTLDAPATVEQGNAILVRITSTSPVSTFTVHWRGKNLCVPTVKAGTSASAVLLLAMPTDAVKPLGLEVTASAAKASTVIRPTRVDWPVQKIALDKKYVTPPQAVSERIAKERALSLAVLNTITPERLWNGPFIRPVTGTVSSAFGGKRVLNGETRSWHRGLDLRGAEGTPVQALATGKVALTGHHYFSGNVVYLDHGFGLISMYAHLSAIHVREGDTLEAGQTLGLVGATGRVTGPHLHLSVLSFGQPLNPQSLFTLPPLVTSTP